MARPARTDASRPDADRSPLAGALAPVVAMLAVMWVLEIVDTVASGRLDRHGIGPRRWDGLDGVLWAPFLHGGFGHLIANSVPFFVLGAAIALGALQRFVIVTLIVGVVGGVGTWLTGPANTVHIGASGLVFGYLTYLLARGFFARSLVYIAGGAIVFMIYGGVLWGLLPAPGISWQGHLFGAIGGVIAAYALHADRSPAAAAAKRAPRKTWIDRLSPPELP